MASRSFGRDALLVAAATVAAAGGGYVLMKLLRVEEVGAVEQLLAGLRRRIFKA